MMQLTSNNNANKKYWSWIIILLMFLSMLIVFLFFGEINLSKLNWLVGINGKKWGEVKDENGDFYQGFGKNNSSNEVSPYIFVVMIAILLIAMVIAIVLLLTNKLYFSSFPFIIASWFVFFVIIVSGLLYPNKNDSFQWQILLRVLLIFITFPIIFFPINFIIKKCLINTKFGEKYIKQLIVNENENAKYINEINKMKKQSKINTETIEIPESQI